ncbi:MAG: DNA topoisomerase 4 subunit A [Christensenellaceae bacterium]|nr:DNA topoisomerase 4 subunit A [Christensenellaceae bacterium]
MAKPKSSDAPLDFKENIIERPIERVLPDAMMPYSEYIILDRALPRVEDGLKPVQRRILYAMNDMHMRPDTPYKKSARVVGECLGKYHPHGDSSVYDAMVRMAQDFNMRMPLVDGHGNFGSIDGDSAAAMRYTEVRLEKLAMELLRDLDKDTVKWNKNFDDTLDEPDVLPGRFPNLLVNGATGIAIGLATNIPPHNLTEVIDGCVAMIENPKITLEEMVTIIKGPDFPTGAYMLNNESILETYQTGRGRVRLRAKTTIENVDGGKQDIVVTEIPYNVNKESLQKRIFDLKETQKEILGGITDVVDESDRTGMRIVIRLRKGENPEKILDYLLSKTDLECNFNVNMVAIADGKPKQLGLMDILKCYLEFQRKIIYKRSEHDINIARKRAHILEGFKKVIPDIDEVIRIIRSSDTRPEAKQRLIERFEITAEQSEAILVLQLGNINKLDVGKFDRELKELKTSINKLSKILLSEKEQLNVVKNELIEIRDRFPSPRQTTIVGTFEEVVESNKAFNPTVRITKRGIVSIDANGGIKFMTSRSFAAGDRGVLAGGADAISRAVVKIEVDSTTLIFGNKGNCYKPDFETFKEKRWTDSGTQLKSLFLDAVNTEKAVSILSFNENEASSKKLYFYTKFGLVKSMWLKNCIVNRDVYDVVALQDGDEIISVELALEGATIIFVTSDGLAVNTVTNEYPIQGRSAGGVAGAKLNSGASVIFAGQISNNATNDDQMEEIAVISSKGYAKKVSAKEFDSVQRNRKGVKIIDLLETESVVFATKITQPCEIAIITHGNELQVLESERIRVDKRESKGRPTLYGIKFKKIINHVNEI